MKKFLYLMSSLLVPWINFCIPVTAGQPQLLPPQKLPPSFFDQGRIGFGIAVEYNYVDAHLKIQPPPLMDMASKQSQTGKHLQVAPCIEFGSIVTNDYYLGLVLSWRYSGLKSKATAPIQNALYFQHEFKLNNYTDILLKTGYKITPRAMVYGLIGPSIANWTHTSNQILEGRVWADKFQINRTSPGVGLGIGFEYFVHKNYAVSLDYTYHFYRSVSKRQPMTLETKFPAPGEPIVNVASGDVNKKIDLSYGVIALRFTAFFQL